MRVSAGFFVTGLSGKMRIQTLPSRFIMRVSVTRAASICRWVIQPGSRAFRPKSPKATLRAAGGLARASVRAGLSGT